MTHIFGFERSQLLLLPEAIDDYVVADNPVRFIDAFVDGVDLAAAGFKRVTPKVTGRPGYAPADLLKLYIYGYLNLVRSSRRLEAECYRNILTFDYQFVANPGDNFARGPVSIGAVRLHVQF
jgi:transposase